MKSKRLACGLSYLGQQYAGWQRQQDKPTVQAKLEAALSIIADHPIQVGCAGRTDAGVSATGQVIHFETGVERPMKAWVEGVNSHLPADIRVLWAREVDAEFNARFSALNRHYTYCILNHPIALPQFEGLTTWCPYPLSEQAMHEAAQALIGEHDFSAFRASSCQSRSANRYCYAVTVKRQGQCVVIDIIANAFLHHMVRNIVGALMEIGQGRQSIGWISWLLGSRDRTKASITAPAAGLSLTSVRYSDSDNIPRSNHSFLALLGVQACDD